MTKEGKTFERTLPAGYTEIYSIDASEKKTARRLNAFASLITLVMAALSVILIRPEPAELFAAPMKTALHAFVFCVALIAYMFLHELVHGAAYKLLTGAKLTFGLDIKSSIAFCGVPDIYVYRKTALIALLAPFCVFLLPAVLMFILPGAWDRLLVMVFISCHVGGCTGDLYDAFLYLFRLRDPATLMNDTGPRQTFYMKEK